MVTKEQLKNYANKLMFDMEDAEYETLLKEFDVILKQMDLIGEINEIDGLEPMTFPFEIDDVELRCDEITRTITRDDALKNADSKENDQVKVPKVVE